MRIRPCVILRRREAILLLRYRYGEADVYGLPGGSPNPGETLEDTLVREVREEISLEISVERLLFVGEILWEDDKETILNCVFLGNIRSGDPVVNPSQSTALEPVWAAVNKLGEINLYPNIGKLIIDAAENDFMDHTVYIGKIDQQWF